MKIARPKFTDYQLSWVGNEVWIGYQQINGPVHYVRQTDVRGIDSKEMDGRHTSTVKVDRKEYLAEYDIDMPHGIALAQLQTARDAELGLLPVGTPNPE